VNAALNSCVFRTITTEQYDMMEQKYLEMAALFKTIMYKLIIFAISIELSIQLQVAERPSLYLHPSVNGCSHLGLFKGFIT